MLTDRVSNPGLLTYQSEDLIRVVISYEIYEKSLWRVSQISYEITTSVRFCFIIAENALLTQTLSMTLHVCAKVLLHISSCDFMS